MRHDGCTARLMTVFLIVFMAAGYTLGQEENTIQNAVLEGIQLSSKEGGKADETKVQCYFIFKDKPSSYFYDLKWKTKQLVFEFNDTELGASPISSQSEPPINGFTVKQKRIDVNEDIHGLKPEWHDVVTAVFDLEHIPQIDVKEEYNVISFSYTWTTDEDKIDQYVLQPKKSMFMPVALGIAGAGALGGGAYLVYTLTREPETPEGGPLSISDLPEHTK